MEIKIPVYEPMLTGNINKYVTDCIKSSWISSKGKYINEFEKRFREYIGIKHALTVSNGTVAIHLALLALDIKQGDEVIVPSFTYVATVNSIKFVNANPVFVDSRRDHWQIDHERIEEKITPRTKAILIAHLYGHPCEMSKIKAICKKHNLFLIEDCAEALGSRFKDKHVGTFGDISTFSFYGNKTITTGEGGMVVTNNKTLADKMYLLKMQGVSPTKRYFHEVIGYNYKMTNICAAIGLSQLEMIDEILEKKIQIARWYADEFEKAGVEYHKSSKQVLNSYWMFSILVKDHKTREALINYLMDSHGIETRPTFYPAHVFPMYNKRKIRLEISEDIGLRGINLPSFPGISKVKVKTICKIIIEFLQRNQLGK